MGRTTGAKELQRASRLGGEIAQARRQLDALEAMRPQAVRQALRAGNSLRAVAAVLGCSHEQARKLRGRR